MLLERFFSGDQRALSRVITLIENEYAGLVEIMATLHRSSGSAHIVGVTGPPGVGKSTLADRLARRFRAAGKTVGVLAVDPSSPFSGGAVLGDRVRMQELTLDPGVYIRSMATRGHLGGLARASAGVIKAMDAFGFGVILVETVGAGQSEVDIMQFAHTTVVVLAPGLGDEIQAIKAGILEIGNIFAVNKADREGAEKTAADLEMMVEMGAKSSWKPPVIRTAARDNRGVAELAGAIEEHRRAFGELGLLEEFERKKALLELRQIVTDRVMGRLFSPERGNGLVERLVRQIAGRSTDPYTAAEQLLK